MRRKFGIPLFGLLTLLSLAAAACSGGSGLPEVTPTAQRASPSSVPVAPTPSDITPTPSTGGGLQLAQQAGCLGCHTTNGNPGLGPTWQGLFGKTEILVGGAQVEVDEEYLRRAIVDPNAEIVQGFNENVMPGNYGQSFSADEITQVIEYIKTLQ